MSAVQETLNPDEVLVRRFTRYLNGPMGKAVLQALNEGESFLLQTSNHTFKVTKSRGRAVVDLLSSREFS
ncbi:MAG: hypothetical protein C4K47_05860 [Candidatus Thorarchaeota archaeon]|nr:MAG: hypothetical protein C4K47_05860 [Candidatus Thorarchaeota archaeon]